MKSRVSDAYEQALLDLLYSNCILKKLVFDTCSEASFFCSAVGRIYRIKYAQKYPNVNIVRDNLNPRWSSLSKT